MLRRSLGAGERLEYDTHVKDVFILVESGTVAVIEGRSMDDERVIELLGVDGGITSTEWSFQRRTSLLRLRAITQSAVLVIPMMDYESRLLLDNDMANAACAAAQLSHARCLRRMTVLCSRDPVRRVAGTLLQLTEELGKFHKGEWRVQITQELMASVAGVSRQSANRVIGELRQHAILEAGRASVVVLDLDGLRDVADWGSPISSESRTRAARGPLHGFDQAVVMY